MTRFGYNRVLEAFLERQAKTKLRGLILLFVMFFGSLLCLFIVMGSDDRDVKDMLGFVIVMVAISSVFLVLDYFSLKKLTVSITSLKNYYVELREDYLCGYVSHTHVNLGDGHYFEIPYEDIRNVRFDGQYGIGIDHKCGTYVVFLDRRDYVVGEINKRINEI